MSDEGLETFFFFEEAVAERAMCYIVFTWYFLPRLGFGSLYRIFLSNLSTPLYNIQKKSLMMCQSTSIPLDPLQLQLWEKLVVSEFARFAPGSVGHDKEISVYLFYTSFIRNNIYICRVSKRSSSSGAYQAPK